MTYIETDTAVVQRLVLGPLDNNCFIVSCRRTGRGVVIDAASDAPAISAACQEVDLTAILTTHGHADHIGAAQSLGRSSDVPVRLHPADVFLTGWSPDESLADGDTIVVGELELGVLHTPGHTPGSTCFLLDGHIFTGDTLFPGGPGATRFDYADFDQIMASLDSKLFTFPDSTPFHPGHGPSSLIGEERSSLEEWRGRRW